MPALWQHVWQRPSRWNVSRPLMWWQSANKWYFPPWLVAQILASVSLRALPLVLAGYDPLVWVEASTLRETLGTWSWAAGCATSPHNHWSIDKIQPKDITPIVRNTMSKGSIGTLEENQGSVLEFWANVYLQSPCHIHAWCPVLYFPFTAVSILFAPGLPKTRTLQVAKNY